MWSPRKRNSSGMHGPNILSKEVQQMMSQRLCAKVVKSQLQRVHATYAPNNCVMTMLLIALAWSDTQRSAM